VPLRQVQEYLGHPSITMTMRYAHLAPNDGGTCAALSMRSLGSRWAAAPARQRIYEATFKGKRSRARRAARHRAKLSEQIVTHARWAPAAPEVDPHPAIATACRPPAPSPIGASVVLHVLLPDLWKAPIAGSSGPARTSSRASSRRSCGASACLLVGNVSSW
jgi:hypothetical protein